MGDVVQAVLTSSQPMSRFPETSKGEGNLTCEREKKKEKNDYRDVGHHVYFGVTCSVTGFGHFPVKENENM